MLNDILLQVAVTPDAAKPEDIENLIKISSKLGLRLIIDLLGVMVLIRFIYYRLYRNADLFFTFIVFNVVIFFISFLLNKVELSMGAAFGLFAVFGMLRYRTEGISIKDMTYLFLSIAMGLISAVAKVKDASEFYESLLILGINGCLILITSLLESRSLFAQEEVRTIQYEKIDLVHLSRREDLIADLKLRTGLPISRVEVRKIDFMKDTATLKVFYPQQR